MSCNEQCILCVSVFHYFFLGKFFEIYNDTAIEQDTASWCIASGHDI